ncbi:MAG: Mur ligase family protein [Chitinophagaceae bacterium]
MNVHFIAIGGSVMHQLAISLKRKGYVVTGSDDEIFEPSRSTLEKENILPQKMGWDVNKITANLDAIILGMHAKEDNPELQKAKALGLKIYSFPEYIFEESKDKIRVAIGGSHGKTSTTSMVMHVLKNADKDFDYLVGAALHGFEQSVNISDAPIIICEADEYPASVIDKRPKFHFLFPNIAVLTGIAWDHINVFPTFDFYLEQFKIFVNTIEPKGVLIYNASDETLSKLIDKNKRSDIRYEPYSLPTYFIDDGKTEVIIEGQKSSALRVFGNHNLLNLHAAYLVCKELGVGVQVFIKSIANFKGAAKRLELVTENDNYNIYRDFAHAPSKVKASIDAVKQQFPNRRLIAVLELHTYSSLNENFMKEYNGVMDNADTAIIFYSSHALELKRMPELLPEMVKRGFSKKDIIVINTKETLGNILSKENYSNSNLLLMSSGNYDGLDILEIVKN